jgi:hypothetical protein
MKDSMPLSSGSRSPRTLFYPKNEGSIILRNCATVYPMIRYNTPEELNLQWHSYENLKPLTSLHNLTLSLCLSENV